MCPHCKKPLTSLTYDTIKARSGTVSGKERELTTYRCSRMDCGALLLLTDDPRVLAREIADAVAKALGHRKSPFRG
jgi:hypothetical protein